eukprot:9284224-Lingulodinium_polyedra.AAC.1
MNLTATNELQRDFPGDIELLPHLGQWRNIFLEGDEVFMWSWDDLKGAFYLLRLSDAWAPVFAFDVSFLAADLGLEGPGGGSEQ